ncbi:hypothetical protein CDEN61S_01665 [Castellaniella denitrificans]
MKAASMNGLQSGLLACPHCGGAAKLAPMPGTNGNWWRVQCQDFHCGGTTWAFPDPDQAATAWNRRQDGET